VGFVPPLGSTLMEHPTRPAFASLRRATLPFQGRDEVAQSHRSLQSPNHVVELFQALVADAQLAALAAVVDGDRKPERV
jgi:hypothetical protein